MGYIQVFNEFLRPVHGLITSGRRRGGLWRRSGVLWAITRSSGALWPPGANLEIWLFAPDPMRNKRVHKLKIQNNSFKIDGNNEHVCILYLLWTFSVILLQLFNVYSHSYMYVSCIYYIIIVIYLSYRLHLSILPKLCMYQENIRGSFDPSFPLQ